VAATDIVPPENAQVVTQTLSNSAPGPTVIPVPVVQGGGSAPAGAMAPPPNTGGGGSGGAAGRGQTPRQPVFPARPAEYVTPQMSY
jgi:hypothetical protein